ncbi:hypothetical protein OG194_04730 [Streptomyces sp. NBC_01288]|uniref:hypothetical protein n=1 Tax=Streptomyces sp. NBC_01288 TaxID=2903814 RepID=UPI002E160149|nr:hypothetical protein OG194_04730 [Streptomyces sp. NBC_01288]
MDDHHSAQLARSALLRGLWRDAIDGWSAPGALDRLPAAGRLLAAGADRNDLARLVRAVAYEAVFATLDVLDEGGPVHAPDAVGGWVVMETAEDGSLTGQALAGLHEDLLTTDPGGRDGADLWL